MFAQSLPSIDSDQQRQKLPGGRLLLIPFRAHRLLESLRSQLDVASIPPGIFERLSPKSFMLSLSDKGIRVPHGKRLIRSRSNYADLTKQLGKPFILKGDETVSGKAVFLVASRAEFDRALESPGQWTAWEHIEGESWNFHFSCENEIITRVYEPSQQILDNTCAGRPFLFGGSEFGRDQANLADATRATTRLASLLGELGFRGLGGCDFVVSSTGTAWLVDINPRIQGSSLLLALRERERGGDELLDSHVRAFTHPATVTDASSETIDDMIEPTVGSQWFPTLAADRMMMTTKAIRSGVYSLMSPTYRLRELADALPLGSNEIVILDPVPEGVVAEPGAPIARVLTARGLDAAARDEIYTQLHTQSGFRPS